eukprot:GHRQ01004300.1.p1 GENE.GHRQ01004300.1~~GHRQ01004300.1.p1  ORF type:complete len:194 (+),score=46.13 GHRQ01004300.1:730-1311(+)
MVMVRLGLHQPAVLLQPGQRTGAAAVARQRVVARFLFNGLLQKKRDSLSCGLEQQQASEEGIKYETMLRRAEQCTFKAPQSQVLGRAGRRSTLEDGERALDWCIEERPDDLQTRVLQLRNLMMQGMGREREVPHRAITALREAGTVRVLNNYVSARLWGLVVYREAETWADAQCATGSSSLIESSRDMLLVLP